MLSQTATGPHDEGVSLQEIPGQGEWVELVVTMDTGILRMLSLILWLIY